MVKAEQVSRRSILAQKAISEQSYAVTRFSALETGCLGLIALGSDGLIEVTCK